MRALSCLSLLLFAASACERAPQNEAEKLSLAYSAAASEYGVPRPILEGIGWVETRWNMRPGEPALDGCYGTMHLCDWGTEGTLEQGARLTGLDLQTLKTDREANIRAAAALLRERADRYFAETPQLSEDVMADWWQIVMHWSNSQDAEIADGYATQVFQMVNRGARGVLEDGSVYEMRPSLVDVSREKLFGEMASPLTPDYAGATWKPALRYTSGRGGRSIDKVVIHTAQGSYAGTISWFQNQQVQASAHFVIRSSDGAITQMVENQHTAWHAGNWDYNQTAIGIEHEGFVDQPSYLTDAMYNASAALTRWLCDAYSIPKTRAHVIGHNEIPNPNRPGSFGGSGGHRDPCVTIDGSQCFWNWTRYMQLVGGSSTTTTGTLRGTVFSSEGGCNYTQTGGWADCNVRVPGARVYIPETGDTKLADENGNFLFTLAPGTYTPSGSASGFNDAGPVLGPRTVTAGGTAWSSFILPKIENTAVVKGFVYAKNPQNAQDFSQRLEGAVVSTSETNLTSAGELGWFRLVVPAGEVTVTASKSGFRSASQTIPIPVPGSERTVEIGLVAGGEDVDPPGITFTRPAPHAVVRTSPLRVEGTVSETVFGLQVGGQEAVVGPDLKWVANVPLEPGENEIEAITSDESSNVGSATLIVTYVPPGDGLDGFVRDLVTGLPVVSAVVSEGENFARTDAEGRFSLELSAGSHALAVQANGYAAKSIEVTIPAGSRLETEVLLTPTGVTPIAITTPAAGATLSAGEIEVSGTVSFEPSPSVEVDGVSATVQDGIFKAKVKLKQGENIISARARTADGRSASASVRVVHAPLVEDEGCGCTGAGEAGLLALALAALARRRVTRR